MIEEEKYGVPEGSRLIPVAILNAIYRGEPDGMAWVRIVLGIPDPCVKLAATPHSETAAPKDRLLSLEERLQRGIDKTTPKDGRPWIDRLKDDVAGEQPDDKPLHTKDPRRYDIGFDKWLSNEQEGLRLIRPRQDNELYYNEPQMRAAYEAGVRHSAIGAWIPVSKDDGRFKRGQSVVVRDWMRYVSTARSNGEGYDCFVLELPELPVPTDSGGQKR